MRCKRTSVSYAPFVGDNVGLKVRLLVGVDVVGLSVGEVAGLSVGADHNSHINGLAAVQASQMLESH